jgi:hypothetical protein
MPGSRGKGRHARWILTAVGRVRLHRGYVTGTTTGFPADAVLGIDGYLSVAATRMAVLAGVRQSFAKAQQLLRELSGWELDDDTIRQLTHQAAQQATASRSERSDAVRFASADGVLELPLDAGKVNTTEGWRDVKLAVFAKRPPGAPATPAPWAVRPLPAPSVRTVVAAVEESDAFADRVRAEADRLGVTTAADVTVLADGAEWIWNLADAVVPQAGGVLDIYHALEHIAAAAKTLWGEGTAETTRQLEAARAALLSGGKAALEGWIGASCVAVAGEASIEPLLALAGYFAKHPHRLGYAERLACGRSIGSGLVEGSIKQLVNLRLKRTGARWCVEHVGPLVELIALADSPEWCSYWMAV